MQLSESSPSSGVVELREDVPLKASAGAGAGAGGCGGPRLIAACFAALAVAVTVALLAQIYSGDYQVVPHGSAATGAEACSAAGTRLLKAGGRAADAAAAAALCLALLAPHRTSLDASGALLYWEYRSARAAGPQLLEWGGEGDVAAGGAGAPRLLAALAALHAERGALPWRLVLQPTIDLARFGYPVSKGLALAAAAAGAGPGWTADDTRTDPLLADYLSALQRNSSAELSAAWSNSSAVLRRGAAPAAAAGRWTLFAGGAGAAAAARALRAALLPAPADADAAERRVVSALIAEARTGGWPPGGVASGIAVVDPRDTYLALVTGLSLPFGSLPPWRAGSAARAQDRPGAPLDLAPALLLDEQVCGTRYVLGAESSAALAQAAAALAAGAGAELGAGGVERARVGVLAGGALALEAGVPEALGAPGALGIPGVPGVPAAINATPPFAAVNVVQQRGDTLASHADSRGGGLASRF